MDNQKTPEEKPNEFLCPKTALFLSPGQLGFEYAIPMTKYMLYLVKYLLGPIHF